MLPSMIRAPYVSPNIVAFNIALEFGVPAPGARGTSEAAEELAPVVVATPSPKPVYTTSPDAPVPVGKSVPVCVEVVIVVALTRVGFVAPQGLLSRQAVTHPDSDWQLVTQLST